jgi:hypothetical protein
VKDATLPYLIDGHNVIGQLKDLSLGDPHDEALLVERLRSFAARKRVHLVVVFDSGLPGGLSRELSTPGVQAVFAHSGSSADAIILERLGSLRDPRNWTVVSADQEIIQAAARRRVRILSPDGFAQALAAPGIPDDEHRDPHLTPREIEEWLELFGGEPQDDSDP